MYMLDNVLMWIYLVNIIQILYLVPWLHCHMKDREAKICASESSALSVPQQ